MKQKKKKRKRKIFLPLFLIFFIIIGFYSHQSYETAMHEQLADSLIEFEQKYPEATDFVENYLQMVGESALKSKMFRQYILLNIHSQ